jgi:hypothetical protein
MKIGVKPIDRLGVNNRSKAAQLPIAKTSTIQDAWFEA